jgi:hypothetical protein
MLQGPGVNRRGTEELLMATADPVDIPLPPGKEGSLKLPSGIVLLRSHQPLFRLLETMATWLREQSEQSNSVFATESDLRLAQFARSVEQLIGMYEGETKQLPVGERASVASLMPLPALATWMAWPAIVGSVLTTAHRVSKLFRVDRNLHVFNVDSDALQLLRVLLSDKIVNPPVNVLRDRATKVLEGLKRLEDLSGNDRQLVKGLLSALNPATQPDAFWALVTGAVIADQIERRHLLAWDTKAQIVQETESSSWRQDRIYASGEVQITYRLFADNGRLQRAGSIIKATGRVRLDTRAGDIWSYPHN